MPWCPRCDETFPEGPACPRCSARLVARERETHEDTLDSVPGLRSIKVSRRYLRALERLSRAEGVVVPRSGARARPARVRDRLPARTRSGPSPPSQPTVHALPLAEPIPFEDVKGAVSYVLSSRDPLMTIALHDLYSGDVVPRARFSPPVDIGGRRDDAGRLVRTQRRRRRLGRRPTRASRSRRTDARRRAGCRAPTSHGCPRPSCDPDERRRADALRDVRHGPPHDGARSIHADASVPDGRRCGRPARSTTLESVGGPKRRLDLPSEGRCHRRVARPRPARSSTRRRPSCGTATTRSPCMPTTTAECSARASNRPANAPRCCMSERRRADARRRDAARQRRVQAARRRPEVLGCARVGRDRTLDLRRIGRRRAARDRSRAAAGSRRSRRTASAAASRGSTSPDRHHER